MANDLLRGRQTVAYLTNKSGGGVVAGDVVILDSTTASSFTTTTSAAQIADWVGVALETIANDASGRVCLFGYVPAVNLASSASLGDYIRTHTVAKQAQRFAATGAGDFGQVLGTGTTPAAMLWGRPDQGATALADHNHTAGGDGGDLDGAVVGDFVEFDEVAEPSTPASGKVRLYAKSDGSFYQKDDAGLETGLAGGGSTADHNHTAAGGDGGDLDGAVVGDFVEFAEVAAPSTPAAGFVRLYAKSDGSFYQKDDAGTETGLAGGGGSGATIHDEAYGSPPGAEAAGDLWLPTDAPYILRRNDGDTAWVPYGPVHPLTLPVDGDFAWINQGGATVDASKGMIHLTAPVTAGNSMRIRKKAAPSTPYTITALLRPIGSINQIYGLCFRQSSDGKLANLSIMGSTSSGAGSQALKSDKFTNPTTFSASYLSQVTHLMSMFGAPWFLRIADDGTNRICSVSTDGINFFPFHSVGRTDFLTADEVGFFTESVSASVACGVSLLSWKEG